MTSEARFYDECRPSFIEPPPTFGTAAPDTRSSLLLAILQAPDADDPRLAFADFVQEQGEEDRAEFIRVQIEKAVLERERELLGEGHPVLEKECQLWSRVSGQMELEIPIAKGYRERIHLQDTSRGFVSSVSLPQDAFLEYSALLFRSSPILSVQLFGTLPADVNVVYNHLHNPLSFYLWQAYKRSAGSPPPRLYDVEVEIWAGLERFLERDEFRKGYTTPMEALEDLSRACVRLGRQRAGLSGLPANW